MELLRTLELNLAQMEMDKAEFSTLKSFSKAFKNSIHSVVGKIWFCSPEQKVFYFPPHNTMKNLLEGDNDIRGVMYLPIVIKEEKMDKLQKRFENDLRRRCCKLLVANYSLTTGRHGHELQAQLRLPQQGGGPLMVSINFELVAIHPHSHRREILLMDKVKQMCLTYFSKTGSLVLMALRRLMFFAGLEGLHVSVMARLVTIHDPEKDKNLNTLMAEVLNFLSAMDNDTEILDPVTGENQLSEAERGRLRETAQIVNADPTTLLLHPDELAPLLAQQMTAAL